MTTSEIIHKDESYTIMGACFQVHNELGSGFLEAVYQEALEIEFQLQALPFVSQLELGLSYKGRQLKQTYKPDFHCYEKVILEIKAVSKIVNEHRAQVHNYLKATGYKLGILVNFSAHPKLQAERIIR